MGAKAGIEAEQGRAEITRPCGWSRRRGCIRFRWNNIGIILTRGGLGSRK